MDEERGFLATILERPDDEVAKLVYADWLEEHEDPRAEFLRLMVEVRRRRIITPEQRRRHKELAAAITEARTREGEALRIDYRSSEYRECQRQVRELEDQLSNLPREIRQRIPKRLQELAAGFDPGWLAVVGDPEIEGCGRTTPGVWRPRFEFVCDRTWADLEATGDETVRHCGSCGEDVHFCDNLADAREHSRDRHCIAVDLGVIRRDGDLVAGAVFAGRASPEDLRWASEQDVDPVSRARLDARRKIEG